MKKARLVIVLLLGITLVATIPLRINNIEASISDGATHTQESIENPKIIKALAGIEDIDLSPSGESIVFYKAGTKSIQFIDSDGTNERTLTLPTWLNLYIGGIQWSHDESWVFFIGLGLPTPTPENDISLWKIRTDGTNLTMVLGDALYFALSPDGSKIAYSKESIGNLWIADANGDNSTQVTFFSGTPNIHAHSPDWSPDGSNIIFHKWDDRADIWAVNADGSNLTQLTNSEITGYCYYQPTYSPDGTQIAYWMGNPDGIWIMNADGTDRVQITFAYHRRPQWFPSGTKFAYLVYSGEPAGIYVLDIETVTPTPTPPPLGIWSFCVQGFFPKHLPDSYNGQVVLTGLNPTLIPSQVQGVYWYDCDATEWKFWAPEVPGCTLTTLGGGHTFDYMVAVTGSCDWEVPLQ